MIVTINSIKLISNSAYKENFQNREETWHSRWRELFNAALHSLNIYVIAYNYSVSLFK